MMSRLDMTDLVEDYTSNIVWRLVGLYLAYNSGRHDAGRHDPHVDAGGSPRPALRISVRCTQVELARWLGIAPNSARRMERGELRITAAMARLIVYTVAHVTKQSPNTLAHELLAKREQLDKKKRRRKKYKRTASVQ